MLASKTSSLGRLSSYGNFLLWILNGAVTGIIVFLFTKFALNSLIINISGYNADLWFVSIVIYTGIIFVN